MTSPLKQNPEQDYSNLPCPAHIAFAFAIVRSKPPHTSIEDYLEGLRRAIVTQPSKTSSNVLDFNADMYWKNSYQKAESERLRLLNELTQLKQEREALQSHEESQRPRGKAAPGKRRRDTLAQPTNKRNKINLADTFRKTNLDLDDDGIDLDIGNLNAPSTDRQAFLRGLISLRRSLLAEPNQETIVNAIQATTIPISRILLHDMQVIRKPHAEQEGQSVQELCTAFKKVYPSILGGLECVQLQTGSDGEQYVPAGSDVVKVFQAFLGRFHKLALDEFARREHELKSKRSGSGSARKTSGRGYSPTDEEDLAKAKEIIRMLVKMVTVLDVSKDAHCLLLEGYLCAILDHIGSSLSLLVFADSDGRQKTQSGLLPPSGLLDMAHLDIESATGTATIEGPYLIFVLRKVVDFLVVNAKRMSEKSLFNFTLHKSDANEVASGKGLQRRIEETLQNTLLRGAFGDDDDTFYHSLRRDEEEEEEADLIKMMENVKQGEDSAEWFIGELWEHLGWDILSGRRGV